MAGESSDRSRTSLAATRSEGSDERGRKVYVLAMPNSRGRKSKKPPNSKGASEGVFGHPLRVAIYARVSAPGQHTIAMQKRQLREYAKRRDWTIAREVEEVGSGAKRRPKRDELVAAARRREIDAVLVWRLDRWGRSLSDLVVTLQELQELGVARRPPRPPPPLR